MAIPLIPIAVGTAAGLATAPLYSGVNAYVGPALKPTARTNTYNANRRNPNLLPDAEQLIRIYHSGGCTREQLGDLLKYQGINIVGAANLAVENDWWNKLLNVTAPQPSVETVMRAWELGNVQTEYRDIVMRRFGYASPERRKVVAEDSAPLDPSAILTLYWRGLLTKARATVLLRHAGYRDQQILDRIFQTASPIPVSVALDLWNKEIVSENELDQYIKWTGVVGDKEVKALKETARQWPSMGELLGMFTKRVFDDGWVQKMQLDSGITDEFRNAADQLGYGWNLADNAFPADGNRKDTLIDYYWRAHWQSIPIDTALEMFHRLRPDSEIVKNAAGNGVVPFTKADLEGVFSASLVPPGIRENLLALSNKVPQRLIVKRLFSSGIIDRRTLKETVKDQGYDDTWAERLTSLVEHENTQQHVDRLRPVSAEQVKKAYRVGSLTRNDAARSLYLIYLNDYGEITQFLALAPERQAAVAVGNAWVDLSLQAIDTEIASELIHEGINAIRQAYLRQELTTLQAQTQVMGTGVQQNRAVQYVQLWTYQLASMGAEASAEKLVSWYVAGILDQGTLAVRLSRLHYGQSDISMMIAQANIRISSSQAKMLSLQQKVKERQAKALAATAKQLANQQLSLQKQMLRSASRKELSKWASVGLITTKDAYNRLIKLGMSDADAVRLLADSQKLGGANGQAEIRSQIASGTMVVPPTKPSKQSKPDGTAKA